MLCCQSTGLWLQLPFARGCAEPFSSIFHRPSFDALVGGNGDPFGIVPNHCLLQDRGLSSAAIRQSVMYWYGYDRSVDLPTADLNPTPPHFGRSASHPASFRVIESWRPGLLNITLVAV